MPRALVASLLVASLPFAAVTARSAFLAADDPVIAELDAHVQRRFLNAENRFGLGRLIVPHDAHRVIYRFTAENDAEARTVAELERSRVSVAIYLAGRRLLAAPPLRALPSTVAPGTRTEPLRRVLEGPVLVFPSSTSAPTVPPPAVALADAALEAFEVFETGGVADTFEREGWAIVARPVRAAGERCLACHRQEAAGRSLKIGDVLGVVLYAHRPLDDR